MLGQQFFVTAVQRASQYSILSLYIDTNVKTCPEIPLVHVNMLTLRHLRLCSSKDLHQTRERNIYSYADQSGSATSHPASGTLGNRIDNNGIRQFVWAGITSNSNLVTWEAQPRNQVGSATTRSAHKSCRRDAATLHNTGTMRPDAQAAC